MNSSEMEIVLVEDNPNDAELISRSLKKSNLTKNIVHLQDGAEALKFLLEGDAAAQGGIDGSVPRVILLDIKLPKVDGIEVLRKLKGDHRTRNIPVVILTSSSEGRDLREAYALGVNSFVTKPIKFDEFSRVVTQLGLYWLMVNVPPVRSSVDEH